jgi:hypothetical protein
MMPAEQPADGPGRERRRKDTADIQRLRARNTWPDKIVHGGGRHQHGGVGLIAVEHPAEKGSHEAVAALALLGARAGGCECGHIGFAFTKSAGRSCTAELSEGGSVRANTASRSRSSGILAARFQSVYKFN